MTEKEFGILHSKYDRKGWQDLLRHLFKQVDIFAAPHGLFDDNKLVRQGGQFGLVQLDDRKNLALFEVEVQDSVNISRNRVALREIAARYIDQGIIHGALVIYYSPNQPEYRFSFISKQTQFDEAGQLVKSETHPKRYTYIFGEHENTRTAESRLIWLQSLSSIRIDDVLEAFSVEKLSNEFFKKYKLLYETLCRHLYQKPEADHIFKADKPEAAQKLMRDFAKKLMGRLVFLHFLQKKGWLGVDADADNWRSGDPNFIRNLFQKTPNRACFHSRELSRLFFKTLNERRAGDLFPMPDGTQVRIPYLNGGLFDDDLPKANTLDFPETWFAEVFEFFGQYNFTIDENAPNDHEVGIDPEMLGHIFENLLEDNKDKGAFYTPKEIVHYMCRESLLEYLKTRLSADGGSLTDDDLRDLERFVREKMRGNAGNFIHRQARDIERALHDVRICDPAIGSGAFPMGLLYEIFQCHIELDLTHDLAALKKDIIHHCIYGVDKDKGAVDIARLRFWLSLVVDEDVPQELPNLDFKIMQGDSLLESFEGIDLSRIAQTQKSLAVRIVNPQMDMFTGKPSDAQTTMTFGEAQQLTLPDAENLAALLDEYFAPQEAAQKHRKKPRPKAEIHAEIDRHVLRHIEYNLEAHDIQLATRLAEAKKDLEKLVAAVHAPDQKQKLRSDSRAAQKVADLETQVQLSTARFERLKTMQGREERPFFLWHLYFRDVFERGGFDIVIGNPPYVQLQKMGKQSEILGTAGFTTFVKTGDLYCLFYEKALRILRPGGLMAFITSNSWLKTKYGEPLRRLFTTETDPLQLLNFEDSRIFKAAIVETNILLAQKNKFSDRLRALAIGPETPTDEPFHELLEEQGSHAVGLSAEAWSIGDVRTQRIKKQIEQGARLLKDFQIDINFGIKTGFNEAFIIPEKVKKTLLEADPKNTEIIKPVLRGRDVQRFAAFHQNIWLIFTKRGTDIEQYPAIKNHFEKLKNQLLPKPNDWDGVFNANEKGEWLGRKGGDYQWFEIQDNVAYFKNFEKPKIIWGELSDRPKFAFDDSKKYPEATLFLLTGEKLKFLLGILNSRLSEWYFNEISTTSGMGTNRWKKYKIENLPVREASPAVEMQMERLVDYILWQKKQPASVTGQQSSDYLEQVLDGLVFELYFGEEMQRAERTVAEHLGELPPLATGLEEEIVSVVFARLFEQKHPVRVNLFHLRSIEAIGVILDATGPKKGKLTSHAPTDNED